MHRLNNASKVIAWIGAAAAAWYLWYADYLSGDGILYALVSLLVLRGFSVLSEKVDGLHWRVAELSRSLGGASERDGNPN